MQLRHFTQFTSKIGLIVFLAGVAAGRLVIGLLTREDKIIQYLLTLFGCAALIFMGLYFLDLGSAMYLMIFLTGITLSAAFPLIITLTGLHFKDHAGTAIGAIKVAVPIGGFLIPFGMSLIAQFSNLQTSLLIFPLALLLAFCMTAFSVRGIHSPNNTAVIEK
jgi:cyanate permease